MTTAARRTIAAVCLLCLVASTTAAGETGEMGWGGTIVRASLSSVKLPRDRMAPVGLRFGFKLKPTQPSQSALSLTSVKLELSRIFDLDVTGLSSCGVRQLYGASQAEAKKACGAAVVGHGNASAYGVAGDQTVAGAHLTLFNGRYQGGPAILAHGIFDSGGLGDYVMPIYIASGQGTFPTILNFQVPDRSHPDGGVFRSLDVTLGRAHLPYLTAQCPLPPGISIGDLKFARTTLGFSDGTLLEGEIERPCKARG